MSSMTHILISLAVNAKYYYGFSNEMLRDIVHTFYSGMWG